MKKWIIRAYAILFITIICMPNLLWKAGGASSINYENRNMAERPQLNLETYKEYSEQFEAYYNDNLPFKNVLVSLNSRIYYNIFHSSVNDQVVIGKNGWLFYNSIRDGDPIGQYQGRRMLSNEQLEQISNNLMEAKNILEAKGGEFVLFILPNKERIYSENMPDFYGAPSESYAAKQLIDYVRENTDIRVVYPYEELLNAKELFKKEIIYHKADTHWNNLGAYVGAEALLKELGIQIPEITSDAITILPEKNTLADLAGMINMYKDIVDDEYNYKITGYDCHNMVNEKWDFYSEIIYHSENADPRKLYVYRDSFCSAISDYIGSQFNNSYMVLYTKYSYKSFLEQDPDIFVLEIVERKIANLEAFCIEGGAG